MPDITEELKATEANLSTKRDDQHGNRNKYIRKPGKRGPNPLVGYNPPFRKESAKA